VIEVKIWKKWINMQKLGVLLKKCENPLRFWNFSKKIYTLPGNAIKNTKKLGRGEIIF